VAATTRVAPSSLEERYELDLTIRVDCSHYFSAAHSHSEQSTEAGWASKITAAAQRWWGGVSARSKQALSREVERTLREAHTICKIESVTQEELDSNCRRKTVLLCAAHNAQIPSTLEEITCAEKQARVDESRVESMLLSARYAYDKSLEAMLNAAQLQTLHVHQQRLTEARENLTVARANTSATSKALRDAGTDVTVIAAAIAMSDEREKTVAAAAAAAAAAMEWPEEDEEEEWPSPQTTWDALRMRALNRAEAAKAAASEKKEEEE
jgi:hypothetical protein